MQPDVLTPELEQAILQFAGSREQLEYALRRAVIAVATDLAASAAPPDLPTIVGERDQARLERDQAVAALDEFRQRIESLESTNGVLAGA